MQDAFILFSKIKLLLHSDFLLVVINDGHALQTSEVIS